MTESAGMVVSSIPERPSVPVQWTVTSSRYQPAALGGVPAAPERTGSVRSMLMSSTFAVAVLPAMSVASPETRWPSPSLESVTGSVQPAMPDS